MKYCIMSRIYKAELPYIESFVKYHQSIGISHIYFLNSNISEFEYIQNFLYKFIKNDNVFLNISDNKHWSDENFKEQLKYIPDDFIVFNIDCDEYINISNINILDNLNYKTNWYFLNWEFGWMDMDGTNNYTSTICMNGKGFGHIDYIKKKLEIRCHSVGPYNDRIILDNYTLKHYKFRSLYDLLNQMLYSQRHLEKQKAHFLENWVYKDIFECLKNNKLNQIHKLYIRTLYLNKTEKKENISQLYYIDRKLEKEIFENNKNVNDGDYELIKHYTSIKLSELLKSLNGRKIKNKPRFLNDCY